MRRSVIIAPLRGIKRIVDRALVPTPDEHVAATRWGSVTNLVAVSLKANVLALNRTLPRRLVGWRLVLLHRWRLVAVKHAVLVILSIPLKLWRIVLSAGGSDAAEQ
jgi:hypothetical protein